MNSETLIKAINYETLSLCLGGSEKEADRAYNLLPVKAPLTENLGDFAHVLNCTKTDVLEKFQVVRRAFENLDDTVDIICQDDEIWPHRIDDMEYLPRFLYLQGDEKLLNENLVSIIGTRNPSIEGRKLALETACELSKKKLVCTSGLAIGIDGVVHLTCLKQDLPTVAVIGTPIDRCYPKEHEKVQKAIAENGGLVISRFSPVFPTQKWFFLLRNRLMSALSLASVIVEDRDGGGAVRQASFALDQGRKIVIFRNSVDNSSILWPRKFMDLDNVHVVKKPSEIYRLLVPPKKKSAPKKIKTEKKAKEEEYVQGTLF